MVVPKRTVAGRRMRPRPPEPSGGRARRMFGWLSSGWGAAAGAVLAAAAGLLVPKAWSALSDQVRPPVVITVNDQETSNDHSYALPYVPAGAEAESLSPPARFFADSPTLRRSTKLEQSGTRITIEGSSSHTVVIDDMRARILRRDPPVDGTLFHAGPQGGGSTVHVGLNLDDIDPVARSLVDNRIGAPYFQDNAVTLTNGETMVFQIDARARQANYTWVLDVDLVVDGHRETRTVQRADGPFHLTGQAQRYGAVYDWYGTRWNRPNPACFANFRVVCR